MHRAGWKLLLPTVLPHERGGGGPGGTLLLLTEQARNCSLPILSVQSIGEVGGRCWICPLNTVAAVRPYHTISTNNTNLLMESLCYNLLRSSLVMRDFKQISFLGIFIRCQVSYLKNTVYVWLTDVLQVKTTEEQFTQKSIMSMEN